MTQKQGRRFSDFVSKFTSKGNSLKPRWETRAETRTRFEEDIENMREVARKRLTKR